MSCGDRNIIAHEVVGYSLSPHSMNGKECHTLWRLRTCTGIDGVTRRDYYCPRCHVTIGESAPMMFAGVHAGRLDGSKI